MGASGVREETMSISLLSFCGKIPVVHPTVYVADGARVIGDVEIGEKSSIWFHAVLRGDVNSIRIGTRTNIQDAAVLHVTQKTHALSIGCDVTVGHRAVLHGCTVEDGCLIGMGAILLDGAIVRTHSMVAAGALVLQGMEIPEGVLAAGVPAQVKRVLTEQEKESIMQSAREYVETASLYHKEQANA
jgi:carbonic anhydrase/acetyltransferase-like protein (isoleucine patch superfamily)